MKPTARIAAAVLFGSLATLAVQGTPLPSEPEHVKSLDGVWRFKLEQRGVESGPRLLQAPIPPIEMPKKPEPFEKAGYTEDSTWRDLKVPGNWEMAGISPATYDAPDNAIGLYRVAFDIPADWQGRDVKIDFDGIQNGAEVFCNGQPVDVDESSEGRKNYHESGWTAFQANLTPAAKFGAKNILAIRVTKNTKSADLDSGDYFFLGGVNRTVRLFAVPKAHAEDFTVQTTLPASGKAEVRVILALPPNTRASAQVGQLPAVEGAADAQGKLELVVPVDQPRLWSAEHPNLYDLSVDVKDGTGKSVEHFTQRVGIREVTIKDGILLINGVPVKFTGMCRHDLWPTLGTALDENAWRKDLTMMKAANVNAVRTSHYPYGSKFYDLCDELGLYVMDEVAACWVPTDTDALTPAFAQRARETARRDKNHPSVVIWAIGNENKPGKNNKVAADEVRKIDATRPRLVSWREAEHANVELDDAHYTNPADIAWANRQFERRAKIPKTYLENPNTWEVRNGADFSDTYRWGPVLDRVWREVWEDDHIPGSFLWEWADRAVADQGSVKLYDFYPETGIQVIKVKGLVDAFRNPRPNLYDVKRVYSPVKLEPNLALNDAGVTLFATNRFSFTDFSELKATWHLLDDAGKEASAGSTPLSLAPRTRGDLKLAIAKDVLSAAQALRVDFDSAEGRNIITYQFDLRPVRPQGPAFVAGEGLGDVKFPHLNFNAVNTARKPGTGWNLTVRHPATLANIDVQTGSALSAKRLDEAALYAMPLTDVRAMDADIVLPSDALEAPTQPANKAAPKKPAEATEPAKPILVAHLRVDYIGGRFTYRVNWYKPDKADVQELGWTFPVSKAADHFSWNRKAYWSYYPADHIARPQGTATPDSSNVQLTKMERPDGYDFSSTKYDCNTATLAHDGKGLTVKCDPDDRQHCRAGVAADGVYALTVNKVVAPPRDISSPVVNDYYFRIEKATNVESSFEVAGAK